MGHAGRMARQEAHPPNFFTAAPASGGEADRSWDIFGAATRGVFLGLVQLVDSKWMLHPESPRFRARSSSFPEGDQ
jgi:hypothetical protein